MAALRGIRVIELAGLAPVPMAGMILADFGAKVTRIDQVKTHTSMDRLGRGKRSVAIDLQQPQGVDIMKRYFTRKLVKFLISRKFFSHLALYTAGCTQW